MKKRLPAPLVLATLALSALPALADDEATALPLHHKIRSDWTVNKYGKDVYDCWNDGVAAKCGQSPIRLEGETEARLLYERALDDTWEFRAQLGAEAYYGNGWTERSSRATGATSGKPRWVAQLMDTWVGLNHYDLGTVRIGSGLNPYQKASGQMDGNTDLGGREYLERMLAYDSPLLMGDNTTGLSVNAAVYDGTRYRKAHYEQAEEDQSSRVRAKGLAVLLDGKVGGNVSVKLGLYAERYGARKYYGGGPLDGAYDLVSGSGGTTAQNNEDNPAVTRYLGGGAKARSRGLAVDVTYEADTFKVGGSLMRNHRRQTQGLTNAAFAQDGYGTGYASDGAVVYFSTWSGPWSLFGKAARVRFALTDPDLLNASSDWLYANSSFAASKVGGEIAYALNDHVKAIVGGEWTKRNFEESPQAGGACAAGGVRTCYDPQGVKLFVGLRSSF